MIQRQSAKGGENMEDSYGKCRDCKKFGTPECPTSSKCLAFDNRPYFEPKQKKKFTISKRVKILCFVFLLYIVFAFVFGSDGLRAMI